MSRKGKEDKEKRMMATMITFDVSTSSWRRETPECDPKSWQAEALAL